LEITGSSLLTGIKIGTGESIGGLIFFNGKERVLEIRFLKARYVFSK
jgi:hypothetical protein